MAGTTRFDGDLRQAVGGACARIVYAVEITQGGLVAKVWPVVVRVPASAHDPWR
jgi:hypothetical protein